METEAAAMRVQARDASPRTVPPEACARDRWIVALLFSASFAYLYCFRAYTNLNGDEGIVLQGAQRILRGQVLYRDFFSFYTPGSYYWTALLARIFGNTLIVARTTLVVYGAVFAVLTYLISRRTCTRWSALLAASLVTLTCLPYRFLVTHWDSTLWAYLALYCGVLWLERQHWAASFAAASFAALTCLFEQSKGAGLVLGLVAGWLVVTWGESRRRVSWRQAAVISGGFVWPFVPTLAYFATKNALREMLADWSWPLFHYSGTNQLPYGLVLLPPHAATLWNGNALMKASIVLIAGPFLLIPALPLMAFGFFVRALVRRARREQRGEPGAYRGFVSACLAGLLLSIGLVRRADFTHINYLAPMFYIAFAWALEWLMARSKLWRSAGAAAALYLSISGIAFSLTMLSGPIGAHRKVQTARGTVTISPAEHTLDFALANIAGEEKIFVYPFEPMYYYLTGTISPTRFDFLQLGMHTPEQFQQSLRDLQRDRTPVVLLEMSAMEKLSWTSPETPIALLGARDPMEGYIFAGYRPCSGPMSNDYWRFVFMVRKDLPCRETRIGM